MASLSPLKHLSWLFTHQISYFGQWDFFPLALKLTFEGGEYIARLSLKHDVPAANRSNMSPDLFEWRGTIAGGARFCVVFAPDSLILRTQFHQLAVFPFPSPGQSPPTLSDRGWALVPTCGSYFFSQYSQSLGHLHPASPGVIDSDTHLRPLNGMKWPAQSPVIIPLAAIPFFHLGVDDLCTPEILQDSNLNHAAWLTALAALTADNFSPAMMAVLQRPSLPEEFKERVADPLLADDQLGVRHYLYDLFSYTDAAWRTKPAATRSSSYATPPKDSAIEALPRTTQDPLPHWIDHLTMKLANLAGLLAGATDLPASNLGWVKCSTLSAYDGPGVPGNFDTHLNQIVAKHSFTASNGLTHTLNDALLRGLVSRDNHRGYNRFQLGHFNPGRSQNTPILVIRLAPAPTARAAPPSSSSSPGAHSLEDVPLRLSESQPYGIYFFHSKMIKVLTRDGINPRRRLTGGKSSTLKVLPSATPVTTSHPPLCGSTDACMIIDMHGSISSGKLWVVHASDGCYGTITKSLSLLSFSLMLSSSLLMALSAF